MLANTGTKKDKEDKMEDFSAELKELQGNITMQNPQKGDIIFYGSSSFRLWPNVRKTFGRTDLSNLAFGGSTLEACNVYFDELVVPFQPKSLLFYAGDNDIGNGHETDYIFENFKQLFGKIRMHFPNIPFAFVSIKPSPSRGMYLARVKALNDLIYLFLRGQENVVFINVFPEMINQDGLIDATLFGEDELHMNQKGYDIWTKKINEHQDFLFPK